MDKDLELNHISVYMPKWHLASYVTAINGTYTQFIFLFLVQRRCVSIHMDTEHAHYAVFWPDKVLYSLTWVSINPETDHLANNQNLTKSILVLPKAM